jgi:predicted amidohydrolase YtcJ
MQKKIYVAVLILISLSNITCNGMKTKVELIVRNAIIYTLDREFSKCDCFAVSKGKFVAVGNESEILSLYEADEILDAEGKYIYPGFIDAHAHFYGYALGLQYADLNSATSETGMIELLKEHVSKHPSTWLVGRGWDQNKWPGKQFPDNKELDRLFPETPVILTRVDGHAVLANSAAMHLIGINYINDVKKGEGLINNGKLTGVFLENTADKLRQAIPTPGGKVLVSLLTMAEMNCFAAGLTSVADAGLDKNMVLLYDSLQQSGELKIRIYAMLNPTNENIMQFVNHRPFITDHLSVRSIKLYADGALGSRGACLLSPYSDDPVNSGMIVTSIDTMKKICRIALEHGYQVNSHAIGDSAVRLVLRMYADELKGKNDKRWRIEHAQVVDPTDIHLFGDFSIIPSIQATHATSDMYWAAGRLGKERVKNAYAYKSLLQQNGWIPNGTDFPIEKINPLLTFYAAVFRVDQRGYPDGGFQTENALSRKEALRSITIWSARAAFEETVKGSIEPGKFADFVILNTDIMEASEVNVIKTKVESTYLGGKKVYQR